MKNKWKNYFNELKYNKFYKYYFICKKKLKLLITRISIKKISFSSLSIEFKFHKYLNLS